MPVNPLIDVTLEMKVLAHLADSRYSTYLTKVKDRLFTFERKNLYHAIRNSYNEWGRVTPESVERYTNKPYPTELDAVFIGNNLDILLDNLHLVALRREAHEKGQELISLSGNAGLTMEQVNKVLEFSPLLEEDTGDLTEAAQDLINQYRLKKSGQYQFIRTGFVTLDSFLGGEYPAETMLLGGEPGTGKTSFALKSQSNMALQDGTRSTMINLEMTKDLLIARMAADIAEVDYADIIAAGLTGEEENRFVSAVNKITDLPIDIVCARGKDVGWIVSKIREYALQGSKVFFIDHLQLIESENDNRNQALGQITLALKNAANKYGVKVVILTQLTDKGGGKYVVRDSGEVESKVDTFVVMQADSTNDIRHIQFKFEKNRNGKLGQFSMLFNSPYQRFIDPNESKLATAAD